jgi:hypothetical protein
MAPTALKRTSPFSSDFTWDDYTNELFLLSDDYGFLTIDQMRDELNLFKMNDYLDITCSLHVDEFVDILYDSNFSTYD